MQHPGTAHNATPATKSLTGWVSESPGVAKSLLAKNFPHSVEEDRQVPGARGRRVNTR